MRLAGTPIAVTGATGFVGRSLVRSLLERGARVVGVVRNPDKVPELREQGVELRRADLRDRGSLARAFEGTRAVFSNAAQIAIGQTGLEPLIANNVEGTRNVLHAMAEAGVKRVVMTSSAAAYRPKLGHHYHETDPLLDRGDRVGRFGYYALSKAMAEREAWSLAEQLDLALTTVRPHQIHGPFDATGFTHWMRLLMRVPVSAFPTHLRLPSVYVGDLTEAMCRCLEREVSVGRAYNLTGEPDGPTYWQLLKAYARAGGKRPRLVLPLPVPLRRTYDLSRARQDLDFYNRDTVAGFRDMLSLERARPAAA